MKIAASLFTISLGLFSLSCHNSNEITDDKPAIKAISFVGIPTQNVHFDAPNARITVHLPTVLSGGLQPIFDLTAETKVLDGVMIDNTIDLTPFCACNSSSEPRKLILRVGNQKTTAVYELMVVATGALKAQTSADQLTFSRKTKRLQLSLPVENLYSNPTVSMLVFTNLATGEVVRVSADAACLNGCINTAPNHLVFSLGSPIEEDLAVGTYSIALNGLNFPQRLLVTD